MDDEKGRMEAGGDEQLKGLSSGHGLGGR